MRNNTGLLAIVLVIAFLLVCLLARGLIWTVYNCRETREATQRELEIEQKKSEDYDRALKLLRCGDYQEARKQLEYLWDYKDGEVLLAYARAQYRYTQTDYTSYNAYGYLDSIPEDYSGDMADEIAAFRKEIAPHRAEKKASYDAEMQRLEEEQQKLEAYLKQLEKQARIDAGKHSTPYIGLSERFIDYTKLGRHTIKIEKERTENGEKVKYAEYGWQNKNGIFLFKAIVSDGQVTKVEDIAAILSGSDWGQSSDPYNASDYAHVDDFYYDHRDDFFNYQDAEDYYDAHH
mgnify:CR=1 FL=1